MMATGKGRNPMRVGIKDRIACFQWTWFTMTMATGGVGSVLWSIPFRAEWLDALGIAVFIFNLCLFVTNSILLTLRFRFRPGSFTDSFTDQYESLFVPSFLVSIATILVNVCQYGVPNTSVWLLRTMEVLFWFYLGASMLTSAGMYLSLWSTLIFPIHTMTPVWVFPAYPLLLSAPFASSLVASAVQVGRMDVLNGVAIAMAAVTAQGTGFLISFTICAAFIYRLMTQKLPRDAQRPAMFISLGPSAFTSAGLVALGNQAGDILPPDFMGTPHSIVILKLLSVAAGLWLWGLSAWFFLVSAGSLWKYVRPGARRSRLPFSVTWFSFVFPNTALIMATEQLGRALGSRGLQVFGCCAAGCLVLVWAAVFVVMVRCLWRRELLWPKDDE
ncbi:C4-dicarboxylate transporter malic acid transporter [Pleurostoma richardsiae]|uniref:C4-dicarboxylate transporter malic acid transporter n=1 Tax=Pleurostoma richardsiae TaxID=41990 RepID=A0AA38RCU4_9PEZI|nr:C4-dicarboxylate transporter malic acid transporter [Pleurostoma richardsiae]